MVHRRHGVRGFTRPALLAVVLVIVGTECSLLYQSVVHKTRKQSRARSGGACAHGKTCYSLCTVVLHLWPNMNNNRTEPTNCLQHHDDHAIAGLVVGETNHNKQEEHNDSIVFCVPFFLSFPEHTARGTSRTPTWSKPTSSHEIDRPSFPEQATRTRFEIHRPSTVCRNRFFCAHKI